MSLSVFTKTYNVGKEEGVQGMISKLDERDVSQTTIHVLSTPSLTGSLIVLSSLVNVDLLNQVVNFVQLVSNFQPDVVKFQCLNDKLSVCTLKLSLSECLWLHQ